jgi:hypothetical protein
MSSFLCWVNHYDYILYFVLSSNPSTLTPCLYLQYTITTQADFGRPMSPGPEHWGTLHGAVQRTQATSNTLRTDLWCQCGISTFANHYKQRSDDAWKQTNNVNIVYILHLRMRAVEGLVYVCFSKQLFFIFEQSKIQNEFWFRKSQFKGHAASFFMWPLTKAHYQAW